MAIQLELFHDVLPASREDALLAKIEKMEKDIHKMRRSFFVRLDAHEKKYVDLKEDLEKLVTNQPLP